MIGMVLAGSLIGAGVAWVVVPLLMRPSLAARVAAVEAAAGRGGPDPVGPAGRDRVRAGLARRVRGAIRFFADAEQRADLALLGIDPATYVAQQLLLALAGVAVAPVLVAGLGVLVGWQWWLWPVGAWLCLVLAAASFLVVPRLVRARAGRVRRMFLATVVTYLDLVAMRVASGAAAAEALRDASQVGEGYGWRRIRAALTDARTAGQQPQAALGRLGAQIAVPELHELSAQLELVGTTGAQSQATLRAQAEALRERVTREMQGHAGARTETLMFGQLLLALGFIVFVGYPALAAVMDM